MPAPTSSIRPLLPYPLARLVLTALLLAGVASAAVAQPHAVQRHFDAGNEHYAHGRYERALNAYRSALETGYASGALYYNLGNACVRTGRIGRAILYYEKARRHLPDHPPLEHSLDVARHRAAVPLAPKSQGRSTWAAGIDPSNPFAVGLVFYLLGVGLLGYRHWTGNGGRWRLLSYVSLLGGLVLILVAWGASYAHTTGRRVVVIASEAPLHTSPTRQAARDTTLQEGAVLKLHRRQPSWMEVHLANGQTGWVSAHTVEEV